MKTFNILILFVTLFLFTNVATAQPDALIEDGDSLTLNIKELYLKDDLFIGVNGMLRHGTETRSTALQTANGSVEKVNTLDGDASVNFGYFLANRFAAGVRVDYASSFDNNGSNRTTKVDILSSVFLRSYFFNKFHLEVNGGYGIENERKIDSSNDNELTTTSFAGLNAYGGLGYDVFINSNGDIALQLAAGYQYRSLSNIEVPEQTLVVGDFKYSVGLVFYFF